jgi:hypothetical protein
MRSSLDEAACRRFESRVSFSPSAALSLRRTQIDSTANPSLLAAPAKILVEMVEMKIREAIRLVERDGWRKLPNILLAMQLAFC